MKYDFLGKPENIFVDNFLFNKRKENAFIYRCKEILYIKLKIIRPRTAVFGDLSQKILQPHHGGVGTFILPAGVGVVDEYGFVDTLQTIDQDVMDDSISKVGGEDFPEFRLSGSEENRARRAVSFVFKLSF